MAVDVLAIPADRRAALERVLPEILAARKVALSTHINSDGDGCGSESALGQILMQRGIDVRIVNPTPWPAMFDYLLQGGVRDESARGAGALREVDRLIVLDISDLSRLGTLAPAVRAMPVPPVTIDHHLPGNEPTGPLIASDTSACATGELIYDLATLLGAEVTPEIATALYTALMTDTGGFRFSNTSARCLAVASQLIVAGVDPEAMYRRIYASVPLGRMHLLREALATLEQDAAAGLAWISISAGALERHQVLAEDLDGIAEYPRSLAGTRLALLFRDLGHDKVKVSFRSVSGVDAHQLARQFGGGGHARAAGALIAGSLADVRQRVVAAAHAVLD